MKKLWIFSVLFLAAGVVMLLLPVHMQPTGVVLLLLGLAMGISALLWRRPTKGKQTAIEIMAVAASAGVVILMGGNGNYYIQRCCGLEKRREGRLRNLSGVPQYRITAVHHGSCGTGWQRHRSSWRRIPMPL